MKLLKPPPPPPPTVNFREAVVTVGQMFGDPCWSRPTVHQVCEAWSTEKKKNPGRRCSHRLLCHIMCYCYWMCYTPPSYPSNNLHTPTHTTHTYTHTYMHTQARGEEQQLYCVLPFNFFLSFCSLRDQCSLFFFHFFYNQMIGCVKNKGGM